MNSYSLKYSYLERNRNILKKKVFITENVEL